MLGAPLWLPLLLAAFTVLLSLLITLWALGLGIGVTVPAVGLGAIALGVGTLLGRAALPLLMAFGAIFVGAGVLLLGALLFGAIVCATARLSRSIWRGCKKLLIRQEGQK